MNWLPILYLFSASSCFEYSTSDIEFREYNSIVSLLSRLRSSPWYDRILKITDLYEEYNGEIPYCGETKCVNPMIELANFELGVEALSRLPSVLLVAGTHGDEATGPAVVAEFIDMIERRYSVNDQLASLLSRVRIVAIPFINAEAFAARQREEKVDIFKVDPNRDFPYDNLEGCLRTPTSILLDRLFRNNMFVGVLTFHGGANSITYPWGTFAHTSEVTSDATAFAAVAASLRRVAGEATGLGVKRYDVGPMGEVVYNVHGGFEDWAFAASWDKNNVNKVCKFGPENVPAYSDFSNRALVFLIEAGDEKRPNPASTGNELAIFAPDAEEARNGNVARNVALAWRFAEMVAPSIEVEAATGRGGAMKLTLGLKGCFELDGIDVAGAGVVRKEVLPRGRDEATRVELNLLLSDAKVSEVRISATCDSAWANPVAPSIGENEQQQPETPTQSVPQSPQTHFVRRRIDSGFSVHGAGQSLGSASYIEARLLDLRANSFSSALLARPANGIFQFFYHRELYISLEHGGISLIFDSESSSATLAYDGPGEFIDTVEILTFGHIPETRPGLNGRAAYVFQPGVSVDIGEAAFVGLLGRAAVVKEAETGIPKMLSLVMMPQQAAEDDSILAPPNGLFCSSMAGIRPAFQITVEPRVESTKAADSDRSQQTRSPFLDPHKYLARILVETDSSSPLQVEINGRSSSLTANPSSNGPFSHLYFAFIDFPDETGLFLTGSTVKLMQPNGEEVLSCILGLRNPEFRSEDDDFRPLTGPEAQEEHIEVEALPSPIVSKQDDGDRILKSIFLVGMAVSLIYIVIKAKKGKPEEPPLVEDLPFPEANEQA